MLAVLCLQSLVGSGLQVSVLDKSKMDWQDFKSTDKEVQEELDAHARSDKQYLDRQVRDTVHVRHCTNDSQLARVGTPLCVSLL